MKPITLEWIQKAEEDFVSAQHEFRARKSPNYNATCFFVQQCIEKYLKARLQEADIPFPKTHDLAVLLDLLAPIEPLWLPFRPIMRPIGTYAAEFRYPGESASKDEAADALKTCRKVRQEIRQKMGLMP